MELRHTLAHERALRRRIMRRVYYAYGLSIIFRPALVLGVAFGASAIAFWRLVSISSIIDNLLRVQLGEMPWYVTGALKQADVMALLAFCVLCTVGMIIVMRLLATVLGRTPARLA